MCSRFCQRDFIRFLRVPDAIILSTVFLFSVTVIIDRVPAAEEHQSAVCQPQRRHFGRRRCGARSTGAGQRAASDNRPGRECRTIVFEVVGHFVQLLRRGG